MEQIETFLDENGHPMEFQVLGKFTVDDSDYVAMKPVVDLEPLIYILRIDLDNNGEECLVGIEDDELAIAQEAYEELMSQKE